MIQVKALLVNAKRAFLIAQIKLMGGIELIVLYTSVDSSSCRKARQWFHQHKIAVCEHNISIEGITIDRLIKIMQRTENGTKDIVSTRSHSYKKLPVPIDELTFNAFLRLICRNPALLKTPIIVSDDCIQIGFNQDAIRRFIPHKVRQLEIMDFEQRLKVVK